MSHSDTLMDNLKSKEIYQIPKNIIINFFYQYSLSPLWNSWNLESGGAVQTTPWKLWHRCCLKRLDRSQGTSCKKSTFCRNPSANSVPENLSRGPRHWKLQEHHEIIHLVSLYPFSNASCERGFSTMNIIKAIGSVDYVTTPSTF